MRKSFRNGRVLVAISSNRNKVLSTFAKNNQGQFVIYWTTSHIVARQVAWWMLPCATVKEMRSSCSSNLVQIWFCLIPTKFNATYGLRKIIACNIQFVNDNKKNLFWQLIALKIIVATIVASVKQRGRRVILGAIKIFGKSARTYIESRRLLRSICESKTNDAK